MVSLVIVCVVIIDGGLYHKELGGQSNNGECASVLGIVPHLLVVVDSFCKDRRTDVAQEVNILPWHKAYLLRAELKQL